MSTPRLAFLLAAVILTTASIAALTIGLVAGDISPGVVVNGLMLCAAVMWLSFSHSGRYERLVQRDGMEAALRRLDDELR